MRLRGVIFCLEADFEAISITYKSTLSWLTCEKAILVFAGFQENPLAFKGEGSPVIENSSPDLIFFKEISVIKFCLERVKFAGFSLKPAIRNSGLASSSTDP